MVDHSSNQLTCLIVGETPSAQFLGWRLSLGSSFIILVSKFLSSDGLVAWKSKRLGANFYTPNIFAKNVEDLPDKLLAPDSDHECLYDIDLIIISAISIDSFEKNCELLVQFSNAETTVLVLADYGCELEPIAISYFQKSCKCVLSFGCDLECRQLSLGSYALVNDINCHISFGLTYSPQHYTTEPLVTENQIEAQLQMEPSKDGGKYSILSRVANELQSTKWIDVKFLLSPQKMAIEIWTFIIPRISLNILSIIYEQFDYEKLLSNSSTENIFKDLVRELLQICEIQCGSKLMEFYGPGSDINYKAVVEVCKQKKIELINSTANEYPEYLSLPFEPYCFYHKFEYPAHILLYQPLVLASKYGVQCSNLNFLFGFYSRLLTLSGLSIDGGRCEKPLSMVIDDKIQLQMGSTSEQDLSKLNQKKTTKKKKKASKKKAKQAQKLPKKRQDLSLFDMKTAFDDTFCLPSAFDSIYLRDDSDFAPFSLSGDVQPFQSDVESATNTYTTTTNTTSSGCEEDSEDEDNVLSVYDSKLKDKDSVVQYNNSLKSHTILPVEKVRNLARNLPQSSSQPAVSNLLTRQLFGVDFLDELDSNDDVIKLPHFVKKFHRTHYSGTELDGAVQIGRSSNIKSQLQNGQDIISKESYELHKQIQNEDIPPNKEFRNQRRKRYIQMELKLWKLQRRFNVYKRVVPSAKIAPYEELLSHLDVLNRGNTGDILKYTSSRYGEVDFYMSIQNDRAKIMSLFQKRTQQYQDSFIKDTDGT